MRKPALRALGKKIGKDHALAQRLWEADIHETRILAGLIDVPGEVSLEQMEKWVSGFDSWDLCDQTCMNLFRKTRFAHLKAGEWCSRPEEYVRRAGFVLIATLAVHDKQREDGDFLPYLEVIRLGADDERNFVRKAVNWALRQIGKRSLFLNNCALKVADELKSRESRSARWIGSDAMRELSSDAVVKRLSGRQIHRHGCDG